MLVGIFNKINTIINIIKLKICYGKKISIGKNISIRGKLYVTISNGGFLRIGDNCFFNNNCSINVKESIIIGNDCLFGESVKMYDHDHVYNLKDTLIRKSGYKVKGIEIGNNCWICSDVIILRSSVIGNNCVIGAKEIIKTSIEDNCILTNKKIKEIKFEK